MVNLLPKIGGGSDSSSTNPLSELYNDLVLNTSGTVGSTTPVLISPAKNRAEFIFVNTSSVGMTLMVGAPTAAGQGIYLYATGSYAPDIPPRSDIYLIADSSSGNTYSLYERQKV